MENAFSSSLLTESPANLEDFPESLKMQLGPFNPQVQDSKALSIHSLHASAFRLRYGSNYPRFPAHLIQHLQPQLFPTSVDQRIHFPPGAFRPFNVPTAQNKLFPSAFAPPFKSDAVGGHDSIQDISPGTYVPTYYSSETDDDSTFRSNPERDVDFSTTDSKLDLTRSTSTSTPSPQSALTKEEKPDNCNGKTPEGGKIPLDSTNCPICGILVLLGDAEAHFFKELEKLSHLTSICKDRKYLQGKFHEVSPCFSTLGSASSSVDENGHGSEPGIPRGRWETYQRIKSNRLSRLRIKNRKKKNGDPVCPVCNEKIQGSVENINLHVEHCLKKHSDEAEEDEDENIDVEGDSEVYGEYEWTGRHLIRATTFLVGGFAAGLLTTASSSSDQPSSEKEERVSNPECEDSSSVTPAHLSDVEMLPSEDDSGKEKTMRHREKNLDLSQANEPNFGKFQTVKAAGRV